MKQMRIKDRLIGEGLPAYIIAEVSANHAGSIERAKEIIRVAKECGADCVKIQTYTADTITMDCDNEYFQIERGTWSGENLYSLYQKAYTPWEWQAELKAEADKVGIDFFSTPFDKTSVDFLEEIGVEFYKIASFELVDLPLIRYVAEKGKPMILSTGMSSLAEIEEAAETIRATGNEAFAFLRCASAYPAISGEMNLSTMLDIGERIGVPVGLSDHSLGSIAAVTAVAMGGCIVEKHLCISRDIPNPDASFSMEPAEFARMVQDIRQAELAKGIVKYGISTQEMSNANFRKSVFVSRDIKKGERFSEDNVRVIRPGYGLHPREYEHVLGKVCCEDIQRGMPLEARAVEDFLTLVPATAEHMKLVYEWANDAENRRQSFQTEPISWETHVDWYQKTLNSMDRKLFICYHGTTPIGQFRVDFKKADEVVISYGIGAKYRKRGYGVEMARTGEQFIRRNYPEVSVIYAEIKPENYPSRKMLLDNGYTETEAEGHILCSKRLK